MHAYLMSWAFAITIAAGAVVWLALDHLLSPRWSIVLRPHVERLTIAVLPLALLFIPLAALAPRVWPWIDTPVANKASWLCWPWFAVRSALYLGLLGLAGWRLRRSPRPRVAAAGWLFPAALAAAFGAIDWLMTLDPTFTSSSFGLYVLSGGVTAALALVAVRTREPSPELARVLLVCVLAWGYFAYTQALIVGLGDRPDDITFYAHRPHALALALSALHCIVPAFLLAPRRLITRPRYLAAVGVLLLVAHALDIYFLVNP
jgi:hypothetical protein